MESWKKSFTEGNPMPLCPPVDITPVSDFVIETGMLDSWSNSHTGLRRNIVIVGRLSRDSRCCCFPDPKLSQ